MIPVELRVVGHRRRGVVRKAAINGSSNLWGPEQRSALFDTMQATRDRRGLAGPVNHCN